MTEIVSPFEAWAMADANPLTCWSLRREEAAAIFEELHLLKAKANANAITADYNFILSEKFREALQEIKRKGVSFDARGTRSKEIYEIACAALVPVALSEREAE